VGLRHFVTLCKIAPYRNSLTYLLTYLLTLTYLEQLKKAVVSQDGLMYCYKSVVRSVLECACPCWHSSLTKEQTKQLEDVQLRALQVIFGNIQYDEVRCIYNTPSLAER